jgi:hypothetical protein
VTRYLRKGIRLCDVLVIGGDPLTDGTTGLGGRDPCGRRHGDGRTLSAAEEVNATRAGLIADAPAELTR